MLYKGSTAIGEIYKGSVPIGEVYKGSTLVWSSSNTQLISYSNGSFTVEKYSYNTSNIANYNKYSRSYVVINKKMYSRGSVGTGLTQVLPTLDNIIDVSDSYLINNNALYSYSYSVQQGWRSTIIDSTNTWKASCQRFAVTTSGNLYFINSSSLISITGLGVVEQILGVYLVRINASSIRYHCYVVTDTGIWHISIINNGTSLSTNRISTALSTSNVVVPTVSAQINFTGSSPTTYNISFVDTDGNIWELTGESTLVKHAVSGISGKIIKAKAPNYNSSDTKGLALTDSGNFYVINGSSATLISANVTCFEEGYVLTQTGASQYKLYRNNNGLNAYFYDGTNTLINSFKPTFIFNKMAFK